MFENKITYCKMSHIYISHVNIIPELYQQISGFCSEIMQVHFIVYNGVISYDHQIIFKPEFTVVISAPFVFLTRKFLK
jgi:hypothetical protein